MQYPAVFYYEWYSVRKWCFVKKRKFLIHVCFPDLIAVGLPASTGGKNRKIAVERAKDTLLIMSEIAEEKGIELPPPTPLEELNLDRGFDLEEDEKPFRIEIENISI